MTLSSSPERGTFQIDCEHKAVEEGRKTEEEASKMIDLYREWNLRVDEREADPEWQQDNMEYDLRTTDWILEKVRSSDIYAQNLYAAMCNRDFVKADTWHLLKEIKWGCSWRHAGGVIADMQERGDYIDWYCSGIRNDLREEDIAKCTPEQLAYYETIKLYVPEGYVTEEIREDLLRLGWIVLDEEK
jgi:hypothetical protein